MAREKYTDIHLNVKELRDLFKQQINSLDKKGKENFVDALIDNLHEDHMDKLNLFTRCLLGVKETSKLNLDSTYYVNIENLRSWEFDKEATISSGLTVLLQERQCLLVKNLEYKPYHSPQYRFVVDVMEDGKLIEHEDREYYHMFILEETFPI